MTDVAPDAPDDPGLSWPSADALNLDGAVDEGTEDTGTEPEAPAAPESGTPAPEAPEGEEAPPVPEGGDRPEVFDRKYVEELRNENANWRVKAQTYEQAFADYDDGERAKFLDLAAGLSDESRHRETAREFVAIGKRILEAYGEDVGELAVPDPNRPLTAAEVEAKLQEAERNRDLQANIQRIAAEVKDLGYEEGSLDHYALLQAANQNPTGDLKQAHETVQAWKKGIIDSFIKEHAGKAGAHLPSTPSVGTGQAPAEQPDAPTGDWATDMANARSRLSAMLDA